MKYYIFYLKEEYIDDVVGAEIIDGCLYAYTDNKKVYKKFKDQRDLSKFKLKKIEASHEDITYLAKNHQNRILRNREILTTKNHYESIETTVAMTDDEYQNVQNDIHFRLCNINVLRLNPLIFRNDILISLCKFGVMNFASYILPFSDNPDWTDRKMFFQQMSSKTEIEPDFLHYFIYLYKNILKEM